MLEVRQTPGFRDWMNDLRDRAAHAKIVARIRRAQLGNLGDHKMFGAVGEMRIGHGPGYRLCFANRGGELIILLCGGDKSTQQTDLRRAAAMAAEV